MTHLDYGGEATEKHAQVQIHGAAHRKPHVKGERGITLAQSRRLYKATDIVVPISSSKLLGTLEGIFLTPSNHTPLIPWPLYLLLV